MSTRPLHTLPSELLHRIIDHLDAQTIFLTFGQVCQRFNAIVNTYDLHKLDFRAIPKPKFQQVCRAISPKNITALVLSDGIETPGQIRSFLSLVDARQLIHLRSLTLLEVDDDTLSTFLKSIIPNSLHSLSIDSNESAETILALLSSAAEKVDQASTSTTDTGMSLQSVVKELSMTSCQFQEYFDILRNLTNIEKLVLKNDWQPLRAQISSTPANFTSSLKSLTITQDSLSMDVCEALLSVTPALVYLKLNVTAKVDRSLLNGLTWENMIETKLPHLEKFEFYFADLFSASVTIDEMNSIFDSFRTPFWIELKQWFVTCENHNHQGSFVIYSIPCLQSPFRHVPEPEKGSGLTTMTTNAEKQAMKDHIVSLQVTLPPPKGPYTTKKNDPARCLYPNVTELHVNVDESGGRQAMEYLFTLINFSNLVKLFLTVASYEIPYKDAISITRSIVKEARHLSYLSIPYGMSFYICKSMVYTIPSLVPKQVKYLTVEAGAADEMQKFAGWSRHVSSIVFTTDGDLIPEVEDISEWLTEEGRDFTHIWKDGNLCLWFTPKSFRTCKSRGGRKTSQGSRKRIKLTTN